MNQIQLEDCKRLGNADFIDWDQLRNASVLITGSTGLIGTNLVNALAYNSQEKGLNIRLILPVRNTLAAREVFCWNEVDIIRYELGADLSIEKPIDYVVHLASPTSSTYFTHNPVETMLANIDGTKALLQWAMNHPVKKFVTLSSMEVYGFHQKGKKVNEKDMGSFDTMNARNSYPIAKIACEALCNSYYNQYGVPVVVLRATQTFGPGVKYDDGRVFAQFMRCAIEKTDIVLKSAGLTERSYLYTADAVSAIIVSLQKAMPGEAYSIANPETYCSIKEMAQMVADEIADGEIKVRFDITPDIEKLGYAQTLYMDLDVDRIKSIGWKPTVSLKEMYLRMINSLV